MHPDVLDLRQQRFATTIFGRVGYPIRCVVGTGLSGLLSWSLHPFRQFVVEFLEGSVRVLYGLLDGMHVTILVASNLNKIVDESLGQFDQLQQVLESVTVRVRFTDRHDWTD
jgi:hypothetical protein